MYCNHRGCALFWAKRSSSYQFTEILVLCYFRVTLFPVALRFTAGRLNALNSISLPFKMFGWSARTLCCQVDWLPAHQMQHWHPVVLLWHSGIFQRVFGLLDELQQKAISKHSLYFLFLYIPPYCICTSALLSGNWLRKIIWKVEIDNILYAAVEIG